MTFRLYCNGSLLPDADETVAIAEIENITGRSEQLIRDKMLAGKRVKLKSAEFREDLDPLYRRLRAAGLDVGLVDDSRPHGKPDRTMPGAGQAQSSRNSASDTDPAASRRGGRVRVWLALAVLALLVVGGGGGYFWYWLHQPLPERAVLIEDALADGRLLAIGHVNVDRLFALQRSLIGVPDPGQLASDAGTGDLLDELLDGRPQWRERLDHLFFALHATPDGGGRGGSWVLSGDFDPDALVRVLGTGYELTAAQTDGWLLVRAANQHPAETDPFACPTEASRPVREMPLYLHLDKQWLLVTRNPAQGERIRARLSSGARREQDLRDWRAYRDGKLAAFMAWSLEEAGRALGGMGGMMAAKAAGDTRHVEGLAGALVADLFSGGLMIKLRLQSRDAAWNRDMAETLRTRLAALQTDSRAVSPALAHLLSRITASDSDRTMGIELALDAAVLDDLGRVLEEGAASLFRVAGPEKGAQPPPAEQLVEHPVDYGGVGKLEMLPALKLASYENAPLFKRGAFAVDFSGIRSHDDGVLEMALQAMVAMPSLVDSPAATPKVDVALSVTSVSDADGNNLLRDERCVPKGKVMHGVRNHEPADFGHVFNERAQVSKQVRLREGVTVEAIASVHGELVVNAPLRVRRFTPQLRAGESVEHAGVRVYLTAIGDHSVSYQVSGKTERLLEMRGLNDAGRTLRTGWRVGSGEGRATQNYQGRVHGLAIYIAEKQVEHRQTFALGRLFEPAKAQDKVRPRRLAPAAVDAAAWSRHAQVDLADFEPDRKRWMLSGKHRQPVATAVWPGMKMFVTHDPTSWSGNAQAQLYLPMLPTLPGVLSALSYRIDEPARADGPGERYLQVSYPYRSNSGEWVAEAEIDGRAFSRMHVNLATGVADKAKLRRLKGRLVVRLPRETVSTRLTLTDLWDGATVDGVTVTLTEVARGTFPGYALRVDGELSRLVNVHGLSEQGERVPAEPINFQDAGYWTLTLPFGHGMRQLELITATRQEILEYPFDLQAKYP